MKDVGEIQSGRNVLSLHQTPKLGVAKHKPNGLLFCRLCRKHVPQAEHTRGRNEHYYCIECSKAQEARVKAHTKRIQREMKRRGLLEPAYSGVK